MCGCGCGCVWVCVGVRTSVHELGDHPEVVVRRDKESVWAQHIRVPRGGFPALQAFLHAGEQPWDYAAGALILEEAGGRIASLQHDDYWRADHPQEWSKSVIAARHPALFDEWKRWVRSHL